MAECELCQKEGLIVSQVLGVCKDCIQTYWEKARPFILATHKKIRKQFGLSYPAPKNPKGVKCTLCVNQCQIGEGERSFCGLRVNKGGRLVHFAGTTEKGILEFYFDPLPTNCVASFVCEGGKRSGMKNLAVFYGACSFSCLFCQNWHFRDLTENLSPVVSAEELVDQVNVDTFCLCFFGGDPTPQLPHALAVSKRILKKYPKVRICFETNGSMNKNLVVEIAKVSLKSRGVIKFDLKAYDEYLHLALTGVSNKWTFENFTLLAKEFLKKADYSFLVASTLLVPGYIDQNEVSKIARFIAQLDKSIPYTLLAFYPQFYMRDLPPTSKKQALECQKAAWLAGLKNVRIGNLYLLS